MMPIMFELLGHFISLLNSILLTNELTLHLEESNLDLRTSHNNHVNIISIDFSSFYHSYHSLVLSDAPIILYFPSFKIQFVPPLSKPSHHLCVIRCDPSLVYILHFFSCYHSFIPLKHGFHTKPHSDVGGWGWGGGA